MKKLKIKAKRRERRKYQIRKGVFGFPERPRFTVFRSLTHIYAQIIDDVEGKTLVAASTVETEIREKLGQKKMTKTEQSKLIGAELAKKALAQNIKKVSFDRNGFLYHGRIKAIADGAREAGLEF